MMEGEGGEVAALMLEFLWVLGIGYLGNGYWVLVVGLPLSCRGFGNRYWENATGSWHGMA